MRSKVPAVAFLAFLFLAFQATAADARSITYNLDIPAQSLNEALRALALASQHKLFYKSELVEGKTSPALRGEFTAEQALKKLLNGTNLIYDITPSAVVLIRDKRSSRTGDGAALREDGGKAGAGSFRIAQAEDNSQGWKSADSLAGNKTNSALPSREDEAERFEEEIVVIGSSIRASQREREAAAQPIQFISAEQLERTSAESAGDFLRKLPINNGASLSPAVDEYGGGNTTVNLRGLGDKYTLVLLEGRRFGGEDVPDVGAVPAEAIEGIEILRGGASSIYGSDAVAGVVNIKLKDRFRGLELHASYGDTTRTDAAFVRTAAVFGLGAERFQLTGSVAYQERNGISKSDRELTSSRDYRSHGGLDRRSGVVGIPHQIVRSSDPENPLSLDLSRFRPGEHGGDQSDYVPYDHDAQAYSTNEIGTVPAQERLSGHWSAEYQLLDDERLALFTRGYVQRRHQFWLLDPPMIDVEVPAENPYNPFGESVHVWYLFGRNELGLMTETSRNLHYQGSAGMRGSLGRFNYEIAYSRYQKTNRAEYRNDIGIAEAQAAASRADATAFNPFGYWANSAEQLAGLNPTSTHKRRDAVHTLDFRLDGELFRWRAGEALFALGAERREVEFSYHPEGWTAFWWLGDGGTDAHRRRDVTAAFAEVRLPLLDAGDRPALFQTAQITLAGRNEKYNDFGSSTVAQVAGRLGMWEEQVILRASVAESFKAPSVESLSSASVYTEEPGGFYYDPVRAAAFGDGFQGVGLLTGGNPDLQPESGETLNLGVVLRPFAHQRALLTLDFWKARLTDIITTPDGQALLFGTATGGAVIRDPVTLFPTLDLRIDNVGRREVSGIDFGASYELPTGVVGTFKVDVNASYLSRFEDSNNSVTANYLGRWNDSLGPIPKIRLVGALQWERGGWSASGLVNHSGGYDDIVPGLIEREVQPFTTVDLQVGYDFGEDDGPALLRRTCLYLGVENAFDAQLPFVASSPDGWDRYIGDYRGRYVYARLRMKL